jgi:hypothetical protein
MQKSAEAIVRTKRRRRADTPAEGTDGRLERAVESGKTNAQLALRWEGGGEAQATPAKGLC